MLKWKHSFDGKQEVGDIISLFQSSVIALSKTGKHFISKTKSYVPVCQLPRAVPVITRE